MKSGGEAHHALQDLGLGVLAEPALERGVQPGALAPIVVPRMMTRPVLGCSSSARQRSRVVLPEPDGPITQTMSFSATGRLTRRSTSLGPKLLEIWSAAMIGPVDGT